jgi:hypothetical protein
VFLPDAVRLSLWPDIAGMLAPFEVEIVAVVPVVSTHDRYISLYRSNLLIENEPDRLPSRWLGPKYFGLDLSIATLLRSRQRDVPLQQVIKNAKGSTRYAERRPGTIRNLSPVADRCLSFIHAPDNLEELQRQSSNIFTPASVAEILAKPIDRDISFESFSELRCYVELAAEPHPYDLLMRTLQRTLAVLAWDGRLAPNRDAEAALTEVRRSRTELAFYRGQQAREATVITLRRLRQTIDAIPEPRLRDVAQWPDASLAGSRLVHARSELRHAIARLSEPEQLDAWDGPPLTEILLANDVFLDAWERHRLSILCAYF